MAIRFGVLLKKILLISTQAKKNSCSTNYRVENLVELLEELRKEGVTIVGDIEQYNYGKFGWIMDPERNKIELWEPVDEIFAKENNL